MTRLFMLEGIIGELSKFISECNRFLKNCLYNFHNLPIGFKKQTSSTESIKTAKFYICELWLKGQDLCS